MKRKQRGKAMKKRINFTQRKIHNIHGEGITNDQSRISSCRPSCSCVDHHQQHKMWICDDFKIKHIIIGNIITVVKVLGVL